MKVKPIYIYLIVFVAFIAAFILFTNDDKKGTNPHDTIGQMPDDDIHKGMGNTGDPTSSNVKSEAKKRLEELASEYEKNPSDTAKAKQYSDMLAMAHQPEKAITILEDILKKGPKRMDVLLDLTFLHFNGGNLDKSEEYTRRMLSINPNDQYAVYNLGIIAHAKGNMSLAKKQLQEVIKKFPGQQVAEDAKQLLTEIERAKP